MAKKNAYKITPQDFGLTPLPFQSMSAANPLECLQIARDMISGAPKTEHYKLVAANAAFIYTRFIEEIPLNEAYKKMEQLIFDGALERQLERYLNCIEKINEVA